MDIANDKPGARANELTGPDTSTHSGADYKPQDRDEVNTDLLATLGRRVWLISYRLEEARQRYAGRRHFMREAFACVALALLRLGGARYV